MDVTLPKPAIAVGTGLSHTCALFNDGTVQCWGLNSAGQLGDGRLMRSDEAVPVVGIGPSDQ